MEASEKKLAAAIGAVSALIRMEEEAMAFGPPEIRGRRKLPQGNLWGNAGRQGIMNMRNMMEMKTFNRLR
ncbi:MAG: hypothetical protein GY695_02670 [Aestuariibacter sp.]|nr:hypothetical protein [Aestuariibacter sp.]